MERKTGDPRYLLARVWNMWRRIKRWASPKHPEASGEPLAILTSTIAYNAAKCLELMDLNSSTESEKESARIDLLLEFTWAFSHITSRYALGFLGPEKALSFTRDTWIPMSSWVFVESYFKGSSDEVKEEARVAFLQGARARDMEYGECRDLLTEGKAFSDDAVLFRLGKRVAEIAGHTHNPATIMMVQSNMVRMLVDSRFSQIVEKAVRGI